MKIRNWISCLTVALSLCFVSLPAQAGWSWGIGYHNPPGATLGLNFMHLWSNWAFETGIGYIGSSENWNNRDNDSTTYTLGGDVNLKYLFGGKGFRPYLQGGFGAGLSTSTSGSVGAGTSISHPFFGGGIFLFGQGVYMYAGLLVINASTLQIGIGLPF